MSLLKYKNYHLGTILLDKNKIRKVYEICLCRFSYINHIINLIASNNIIEIGIVFYKKLVCIHEGVHYVILNIFGPRKVILFIDYFE